MSSIATTQGSLANIQKAGNSALVAPVYDPSVDLLDPESMMAFFSLQMSNVRGQLSTAMKEQDARNQLATSIQKTEARLSDFSESGIVPGDPRWDDFEAAANQAIEQLGGPNAGGTKLAEDLARLKGQSPPQFFGSQADANAFVKDHGGVVTEIKGLAPSDTKWLVSPAERDPAAIKGMVAELKAFRDGIQNDNGVNMIRVQQLVDNSTQLTSMFSNIMKKINDMAMASINNMR
jgi:hypothetical protein